MATQCGHAALGRFARINGCEWALATLARDAARAYARCDCGSPARTYHHLHVSKMDLSHCIGIRYAVNGASACVC